MATMPSVDVQQNWWHISAVQAQQAPRSLSRNSMMLPRLLMQNSSRWSLLEVKRDLEKAGLQKNNLAVQLRRRITPTYGTNAGSLEACEPVSGGAYTSRVYMLDKQVAQKMTISLEDYRCINERQIDLVAAEYSDFWHGLNEQLSQAVEQLIYSKDTAGNFQYIGSLPPLTSPGAPRPFAQIPLLDADGRTVNPAGLTSFAQDMDAVGAGDNYFAFGNTRALVYAQAKNIAVPNLNGYNVAALNDTLAASRILNSYFIGGAFTDLGINNPLVVVEEGALYFASAPYFDTNQATMGKGQKFFSMMHPNLPGVWVNITETINEVCAANTLPSITWTGTIIFNVIGKMTCDYDGGFFSEGNNGVYLYDITCADTSGCELPNRTVYAPTFVLPFGKECAPEAVCDTTCRIDKLPVGYQDLDGTTYAVFNVVFTPAAGGSQPTSFLWEINGTEVVGQTGNILLVNVGLLNDGDIVTVTPIGSADCTAEAEFIVEVPAAICGELRAVLSPGFTPVVNGATIEAGSFAIGAVEVVRVNISALDYDVTVASATRSNVSTILTVSPALPSVLTASSGDISFDLALGTAIAGTFSSTVKVNSNACDEEFIYTINWTVTP